MRNLLLVALFALCCCSVASTASSEKFKGLVFGAEEWSPLYAFDSPESVEMLSKLKDTGATWVRVLVTWFQQNVNTTTIYPIQKPSLLATATDDELAFIINEAHRIGLKVVLSPIVDPDWSYPTNHRSGSDMTWRGLIGLYWSAAEWSQWFANYEAYIGRYAKLAQSLGVEMVCIGAELNAPFTNEASFRQLITNVRSVYSGLLTVATLNDQAISNCSSNCPNEWPAIQWYDAIDVIGVDGYFPLPTATNDSTVAEIVAAWQPIVAQLEAVHQKWNRSIIFTEIGYTSAHGSHLHPAHMELIAYDDCSVWELCVNLQEQANSYEAAFEALWNQPWFQGTFWWLWRTDPHDGHSADPGFSPHGKPAEKVLQKWYQANATATAA